MKELIERLRTYESQFERELADALEQQAKQIEELAAEREKVKEAVEAAASLNADVTVLGQELAAAQATIEQMREQEPVYQLCKADSVSLSSVWIDVSKEQYDDAGMYPEYGRRILYAVPIALPTNLDALHEARAQELELIKDWCKSKSFELYSRNARWQHHTGAATGFDSAADFCAQQAAAHRAKKGK